jgi:hypothetical protein
VNLIPKELKPMPKKLESNAALPREIARRYKKRGWKPIPIFDGKNPNVADWQNRDFDPETDFPDGCNVGVQMGECSDSLVDVDLDCLEARKLAAHLLPPTKSIFGRKSKPKSHRLYYSKVPDDRATIGFKFAKKGESDESVAILDLKLGSNKKGSQSVFPGSIHKSTGERIEWWLDERAAQVEGTDLWRGVVKVAIGSVLLRRYKSKGDRHNMFLVIGGVLARANWDRDEAAEFAEIVTKAAGDDETADRVKAVRDAWKAHHDVKNSFGFPQLKQSIGDDAVQIWKWLGLESKKPLNQRRELNVVRMDQVQEKKVDWLWKGHLAIGELTQIYGSPGQGKSQLCLNIAARISSGRLWPDRSGNAPVGSVIILASEDALDKVIKPRLRAAGADMKKIHCIESTKMGGKDSTFSIQRDLDLVEHLITSIDDVRLVVMDPFSSYLGQQINPHLNTQVRSVVEPLRRRAEKHGVAVLLNGHVRKGANEKATDALSGSAAFIEVPRLSFLVHPDPENNRRKLLLPVKNNLGEKPPGLAYFIVPWKEDKSISRISWSKEPVHETADEVISRDAIRQRLGTPDARNKCKKLLYSLLKNGKMEIKEIKKAAAERGLNWRTMRGAFEELRKAGKLESKSRGFGPNRRTWWRMKPDDSL